MIHRLFDAIDSISGATFISACVLLLVVVGIADRVVTNHISKS